MKFFIPHAKDENEGKSAYESIKKFLKEQIGADTNNRKVFSLTYKHNGNTYHAEVGKQDEIEREVVIAILYEELRSLYHVCTPNRGVIRGISILVGDHDVISVTDFEN